jgi:peptidoglycan hydrolase-like protein with peptidoglycan-binding domain
MLKNKLSALAVALFVFAVIAAPASALTVQEQIDALLAQIAQLQGGTTTTTTTGGYQFTKDLTIGSMGADVTALQDILIAKGALVMPAGVAKGYFGALTKAAVAKWQAMEGIAPAAGYVGPISRAKLNAMGGTTTPTTPGSTTPVTGTLEGDFGTISDVDELGAYNNEEVGEGQDGVKVLGAEIEASDDGDISLTAVKISFDSTGNTGSDNLDDYVSDVTVMLDGEEVGSADVDGFSENGSLFTKTIALSEAVIKADETAKLYVVVDAVNSFDSADISGDSWTVDIESIKFVDGSGDTTTDTSTGDIDGMDVPIDFVSFSTAADTELKISSASDNPEAGIVIADDSSNTDNVTLLKGKLKLEGTSDVVIDEFPVTFTATANGGTADGVDDIAGSVTLIIDGEEYSETMSLTSALVGTVTFDNLDFDLSSEDTVEFEVLADINDIDGTVFVAGATLKADVTASNRNLMDVENSEGDQLSDSSEKSGTATGEAQEFRTSGIMLTLVSTATDATTGTSAGDDIGLFTIKYKVTAVGDTVYVSSLADATTAANTDGKTSITIDRAGTATATNISVALVNNTDTDLNAAGLYTIEEGESETFEVSASVPMNSGTVGQHRMSLSGVRWTTDSTDATPSNSYTSNLDSFKTSYKVLN